LALRQSPRKRHDVGLHSTRCRRARFVASTLRDPHIPLRLTTFTFAYPGVPAERRADLALVGEAVAHAHNLLRGEGVEAFVLSTCLRVELAVVGDEGTARKALGVLYDDADGLSDLAAIRHDEDGFLHLCRVAAGLESPVVGELEVLGQFRSAVAAFAGAHPGSPLKAILDSAVGVARAARRRSNVSPRGSLAAIAAREVSRFGRVAIFGAGAMARAAADELAEAEVTVFSRRPQRMTRHATRSWEEAFDALAAFPAVVSTVPGSEEPFPSDRVSEALAFRRRPLVLVDLGMPPAFRHLPETPLLEHLTIDDVADLADSLAAPDLEASVAEEAQKTWSRLSAPDRARTVIAEMVDQAESAVDEEVSRFAGRLHSADDPEEVLRQTARTVARRILHGPISYINDSARKPGALDVLAEAFGVDR
jgi:glutamyl-tRNA reductase